MSKNKLKLTKAERKRKRWLHLVNLVNKQYTPAEINRFRQIRTKEGKI